MKYMSINKYNFIKEGKNMHISRCKVGAVFLFSAITLLCNGDHWTKRDPVCNLVNDTYYGEKIKDHDVDQLDNHLGLTYIRKTKETALGFNGNKFWNSLYAKENEPKDIVSISSKSVKTWAIALNEDKTRFVLKVLDGTIWGITKKKELCKFVKGTDGTFEWQVDPSIKNVIQVVSGYDGDTWILAKKQASKLGENEVYHLQDTTWEKKAGKNITCLAVADKDHVFSLTTGKKIYKWDPAKNDWTPFVNALAAKNIAVGADGVVWQVTQVGTTEKLDNKKWVFMGGMNIKKVAVGKTRAYSITNTLVAQAARKYEFQFLPSAIIWEVYVRPSEIIRKKSKALKTPKKEEVKTSKKVAVEKVTPAVPQPEEQVIEEDQTVETIAEDPVQNI